MLFTQCKGAWCEEASPKALHGLFRTLQHCSLLGCFSPSETTSGDFFFSCVLVLLTAAFCLCVCGHEDLSVQSSLHVNADVCLADVSVICTACYDFPTAFTIALWALLTHSSLRPGLPCSAYFFITGASLEPCGF